MLILKRCRLAFTSNSIYKYITVNAANDHIGDDGVRQLSKGKWPFLQELKLRNFLLIEKALIFRMKGADTSVKLIGLF